MSHPLVGVWALTSWEHRTEDGEVIHPLGTDLVGLLIVTENGYWSAQVMDPGRPSFAAADLLGGTPDEVGRALRGYVAYTGAYEIRDDRVIVHVRMSLFPNWVGQDQERFFTVTGDQLDVSTKPFVVRGKEGTTHTIFQRVR